MSDTTRTKSGVTVYVIPEDIGGPAILGKYALAMRTNPEGDTELRMVHYEGVAYLVTDEKPWCFTDYDATQKFWTPAELIAAVATRFDASAECDLADWVRDHNARTSSNYFQILQWATEYIKES